MCIRDSILTVETKMSGRKLFFTLLFVITSNCIQWNLTQFSIARSSLASGSFGSSLYFGGGRNSSASPVIDVYDIEYQSWRQNTLRVGRWGLTGTTIKNFVLFAGGYNGTHELTIVDIFDMAKGLRINPIRGLTSPRTLLASTSSGKYAFFGGGLIGTTPLNIVEIYDIEEEKWLNSTTLSTPRSGLSATTVGNLVFFAGGGTPTVFQDNVDIFNLPTMSRNLTRLQGGARWMMAATSNRNFAIFAGGFMNNSTASTSVDIYDTSTRTWTLSNLRTPRYHFTASTVQDVAYFAGGWNGISGDCLSDVEVYDILSKMWKTSIFMKIARADFTAVTLGNSIFFAGGSIGKGFDYSRTTASVEILTIEARISTENPQMKKTDILVIVLPVIFGTLAIVFGFFAFYFFYWRKNPDTKLKFWKKKEKSNNNSQISDISLAQTSPPSLRISPPNSLKSSPANTVRGLPYNSSDTASYRGSLTTSRDAILPPATRTSLNTSRDFSSKSKNSMYFSAPSFADGLKTGDLLGKGASGVVYKGTWNGRPVAVKRMNKEYGNPEWIESFKQECELMRRMEPHPNVLKFFGMIEDPLSIITEFCDKGSLVAYLENDMILINMKKRISMMRSIALGMEHLTRQKIVHRDLAARNCLLKGDFEAVVADFGMSRLHNEGSSYLANAVNIGWPLKWMAPETLRVKSFSEKTDVYSFGVVCLEILTRLPPYPDYTVQQFGLDVIALDLVSTLPSYIPENTPDFLSVIIRQCVSKDPNMRPTFRHIVNVFEENHRIKSAIVQ
eukprot:TRINITY_DN1491_c0_g1_i4.p1 TRINITY_DN1491_c0_g1~~TRINITY_DN1491_c0_g1_i4.p1  ORF type:complete len:784 (+),score=185.28 TRINITY_DN1491_c0_g1_i4:53-2404(+)